MRGEAGLSRGVDEDNGGIGIRVGWCFHPKHLRGVENRLTDGLTIGGRKSILPGN